MALPPDRLVPLGFSFDNGRHFSAQIQAQNEHSLHIILC